MDEDSVPVPVPPEVDHAILMIAADLFENREAGASKEDYSKSPTIAALLRPHRANMGV